MSARKRGKVLARPATVEQTAEPEKCEEVQVRESIQCLRRRCVCVFVCVCVGGGGGGGDCVV